ELRPVTSNRTRPFSASRFRKFATARCWEDLLTTDLQSISRIYPEYSGSARWTCPGRGSRAFVEPPKVTAYRAKNYRHLTLSVANQAGRVAFLEVRRSGSGAFEKETARL